MEDWQANGIPGEMKSQRQKYLKIEAIMTDKGIYRTLIGHFLKPIIETRAIDNSSTG